jgi:hypothetical protein
MPRTSKTTARIAREVTEQWKDKNVEPLQGGALNNVMECREGTALAVPPQGVS